ncbi:MAG: hypothetical protein H6738_17030 [Alphaproteobacteria bacterium]|nr:hypothetical protein [Alphaproteobacteria bacterium]MCB9698488.1 hypothetical protein [Alphaproteobacteria bacterium]
MCDDLDLCVGEDALGDVNGSGVCDLALASVGTAVAGSSVAVTVAAPVSGTVFLVVSTVGAGGNTCHPTANVCTPLENPIVATSRPADFDGTTTLRPMVPVVAAGSHLWVQAIWVSADGLSGEPSDVVEVDVASP